MNRQHRRTRGPRTGRSGLTGAATASRATQTRTTHDGQDRNGTGFNPAGMMLDKIRGAGNQVAQGLMRTAQAAAAGLQTPQHDVPAIRSNPDLTAGGLQTELTNSPHARTALDDLTGDTGFSSLQGDQQGGLLQTFQEAPNAATAQYLKGLAAYHTAQDKDAGFETYTDMLNPDSGTFSVDGTSYTIVDGQLQDSEGNTAGNIRTDGTYQMNGDENRTSIYDDIHARVHMVEGEGQDAQTLLNLHDSDPHGRLTHDNMNDSFTDLTTETIQDLRRENIGMWVTDGYRSIAAQDRLYNKGRTAPGDIVTGARGGESWHNYGLAADLALQNSRGQPHWSTSGDNGDMFDRYGEVAGQNGLSWGGNWTRLVDLPHVELHPGYDDHEASQHNALLRSDGLEAVWDSMGIGEQD